MKVGDLVRTKPDEWLQLNPWMVKDRDIMVGIITDVSSGGDITVFSKGKWHLFLDGVNRHQLEAIK